LSHFGVSFALRRSEISNADFTGRWIVGVFRRGENEGIFRVQLVILPFFSGNLSVDHADGAEK